MALATIQHLVGGGNAFPVNDLQQALAGKQVAVSTTTWEFADSAGHRVVFTGSFALIGDLVQNGTVTGFDVYYGDEKLMTGSGYVLTDDAVLEARDGAIADDYTVFYPVFYGKVREIGTALSDHLYGSAERGKFLGMDGNDFLYGDKGRDVMKGGAGDDWVEGRGATDKLFGNEGADTFAFTNADKNNDPAAKFSVQLVRDFDVGADTIFLDAGRFTALDPGPLDKAEFGVGRRAGSADEHVFFHKATGDLFYDEDGSGGAKKVLVAELDPGIKLKATHFDVDFVA